MYNPEKPSTLCTQIQDDDKQSKTHVLYTTMRKETQITYIRHQLSYKTTGGINKGYPTPANIDFVNG